MFAARVGDLASAKLLVAAGANVNDADAWGVSATVLAAHSGFRRSGRVPARERAPTPNAAPPGFTALHAAIMRRDDQMVTRAARPRRRRRTRRCKTWTPTRRSSRDFNFAPELVGATPFWLAARFNEPDVMRLLLKHGADPRVVHHVDYHAERSGRAAHAGHDAR